MYFYIYISDLKHWIVLIYRVFKGKNELTVKFALMISFCPRLQLSNWVWIPHFQDFVAKQWVRRHLETILSSNKVARFCVKKIKSFLFWNDQAFWNKIVTSFRRRLGRTKMNVVVLFSRQNDVRWGNLESDGRWRFLEDDVTGVEGEEGCKKSRC